MDYVMGEDGNYYEVMGDEFQTVGVAAGGRPAPVISRAPAKPLTGLRLFNPAAAQPTALRIPAAPSWRPAIAPGVPMPGESEEQLSLVPDRASGVFSSALTQITYEARPQRPFRAERLVAIIGRVGATAAGALPVANPGFFVGTNIVGANLGDTPLDAFGPTAFGVRLQFPQATPGMLISIPVTLRGVLTGTDTVTVSLTIIGRSIRLGGRYEDSPCHSGQDHYAGHSGQRA